MISYFIAKYVDDLTRNEPDNVGVIVSDGERVVALFDGEDRPGHMDLRRVRHRITGSHAYKSWVHYWRAALTDPAILGVEADAGADALVKKLIEVSGGDFYVEEGGTIILDADDRALDQAAQELYERLVREPDPPSPIGLREKSRDALASAGAPMEDQARFREQVPVNLDVDGVSVEDEVSFAVMNGKWHYLQEMPFDPGKPRISRKEASHCAFLFEHAGWEEGAGLILYDSSDISAQGATLLKMLESFAPLVDVDHRDEAAEQLHTSLNLG